MKENNKGSIIILTIIGIATLLIAVVGATFAYFTVNIQGNPSTSNVTVESKTLGVIEYKTLNEITYQNAIPGRPDESFKDNKLDFTLTSAVDATDIEEYEVFLNVEENEYTTNNVVYVLNENIVGTTTESRNKGVDSIVGGQYFSTTSCSDQNSNCVDHTFEGETNPVKLGFIPANFTGKMKIGQATLGGYGSKDEWNFELWVNEIGAVQNEDQGKIIKAYITIELANMNGETNEIDKLPTTTTTP